MDGGTITVFLAVVSSPAVLALLGISFINIFAKSIFPSERKVVPYNSNPVPFLAINDQPPASREQRQMIRHNIHTRRCTTPCVSEEAKDDRTEIRRHFFSRNIRERASRDRTNITARQYWSMKNRLGHYCLIPNRPCNVSIFDITNVPLFIEKHHKIATAFCTPSPIKTTNVKSLPVYLEPAVMRK